MSNSNFTSGFEARLYRKSQVFNPRTMVHSAGSSKLRGSNHLIGEHRKSFQRLENLSACLNVFPEGYYSLIYMAELSSRIFLAELNFRCRVGSREKLHTHRANTLSGLSFSPTRPSAHSFFVVAYFLSDILGKFFIFFKDVQPAFSVDITMDLPMPRSDFRRNILTLCIHL